MTKPPEPILTLAEAGLEVRLSAETLRRWIVNDGMPAATLRRPPGHLPHLCYLVVASQVRQWIWMRYHVHQL